MKIANKKTKKSGAAMVDNARQVGVSLSLGAMVIALFILSFSVLNSNGPLGTSNLGGSSYLQTQISQDNRERIPADFMGDEPMDSSSSSAEIDSLPRTVASEPLAADVSSASGSGSAASGQEVAVSNMVSSRTTPASGMPENMVIGFAIFLGIFGSVSFLVFKKGV